MAAQTAITRVESFPFDSKADGYDSDGYPVYDRAVGAAMLRSVFEKYFSDGVFGEPADALQIKKAATGLAVTIDPGIFIINGAMGGWKAGSDPVTVTLTPSAPQGNTAYGIMLRYDENDTEGTGRSLSVRVVAGDAASSPQPPAPDQTSPGVMEYRLGYVVVPSGATNLTNATVHNEKGSAVCPYAAPFEKIDISAIMDDVREQAGDNLNAFMDYLLQNIELIKSALDETTAGNLQNQIDALQAAMLNEENLNPAYLEMTDSGTLDKKWLGLTEDSVGNRELKDASVGEANLIDLCVTDNKLSYKIQQLLGLFDASDWDYDQMYEYITRDDINDDLKNGFVNDFVTADVIKKWTDEQLNNFVKAAPVSSQKTIISRVDLPSKSLKWIGDFSKIVDSKALSAFVGKTIKVDFGTYGTDIPCVICGASHDTKTTGGKAKLTLMNTTLFLAKKYGKGAYWQSTKYSESPVNQELDKIYNTMSADDKQAVVSVKKSVPDGAEGSYFYEWVDRDLHLWTPESHEVGNSGTSHGDNISRYEYWTNKSMLDSLVDNSSNNENPVYEGNFALRDSDDCTNNYEDTFVTYQRKRGGTPGDFKIPITNGASAETELGMFFGFCIG